MSWKRLLLQLLAAGIGYLCAYAGLLRWERRALAGLTLRGDPRWGPLWPLVDTVRALVKRGGPLRGRVLLGPLLALGLALIALLRLPAGPATFVGNWRMWTPFSSRDLDLLSLTAWGLAPALGTWLTGALSPSAGVRAGARDSVSRALVYAAPGALALAGAALVSGILSVSDLVRWQSEALPLGVYQPLGLVIAALSAVLAGRRLPASDDVPQPALLDFDLQHAGAGWATAHLSEFLTLLYYSTAIALVYLGGWDLPAAGGLPAVALKALAVLAALLWLRQRWYRTWRARHGARHGAHALTLLLALGLANLLVTAVAVLGRGTL